MILPAFITKTIHTLEANGFEAYVVGGSVRDSFLRRTPTDWDIATSALPSDIIEVFGSDNCIPTGIKHGTVTLVTDNRPIEITTYRIDGEYLDNRHPAKVTFSRNILEDLSRRDFTINAMAYNPKNGILDPFGGKADLVSGIIRTVGEPEKRFSEDALRIMRALRFAAVLNFKTEEHTKSAIHGCKELLKSIAKERLNSEFSKLVAANNPEPILTEYSDVFAEVLSLDLSPCLDVWAKNAKLIPKATDNLSVRLTILLDGISQDIPPYGILKKLKFDNRTIHTVKTLSSYLAFDIIPDPIRVKHILAEVGEAMLRLILAAKSAKQADDISVTAIENILNQIVSTNQCYRQKDLVLNGNDLIALGISGAEIGKVLKQLLNEVIEERCENKKEALIKMITKIRNTK